MANVVDIGDHNANFMDAVREIALSLQTSDVRLDRLVKELNKLRLRGGRLFCIGVGGGAANASHAVNDFRKLCEIEAYAPTDNVAELSARTNDEGWDTVFEEWLKISRFNSKDALFVFSVGGGTIDHHYSSRDVSANIAKAVTYVKEMKGSVFGIVGKQFGVTAQDGDVVVIIYVPENLKPWLTPLTEAFQMVVLHSLVSHPKLQRSPTKW